MLTRSSRSERTQSSSHHARKCTICSHPDREDIEDAFLHWRDPRSIIREFGLAHHSAIYRHAHATGLVEQRKANLYTALEYIIEKSQSVKPTANAVITAIRICAQMDGLWTEPPKTHIVIHKNANELAPEALSPPAPISNREPGIRT